MAVFTKDMEISSPDIITDTNISSSVALVGMSNKAYTERLYKSTINSFYLRKIKDKLEKLKLNNSISQLFNKNGFIMVSIRNILPDKKKGNRLIMKKINNKELEVDALVYLDSSIALDSIEKIKVILSVIKINNNEVVVKVKKHEK